MLCVGLRFSLVVLSLSVGLLAPTFAAVDKRANIEIILGGFFANLDTKVRLDASDGTVGTVIDFESSLNLTEREALPYATGLFRLSRRNSVAFSYFNLERTSFAPASVEIRFGDVVIPVDTPVNTFFDTEVLAVTYNYSFLKKPRGEMAFMFGLDVMDVRAGIETEDETIAEQGDFIAPLPTLGFWGTYALTRSGKLHLLGSLGVFGLEIGDYKGAIVNANLGFVHETFKHVGLGMNYTYFRVDVETDAEDWQGELKYEYFGPVIFLELRF